MRITCRTLEDFLSNISSEMRQHSTEGFCPIHRQVIHCAQFDNQLGKEDSARYEVMMHVSTVVVLPNDDQYLIESGEICGIDYRDSTNELNGTERAASLTQRLEEFCEDHHLQLRPGVVDY